MQLTERHIIRPSNPLYKEMDKLCFLSKNVYNSSLYAVRQEYIHNKKYLNYYQNNDNFVKFKQNDYYQLPAKVSQQTMRLVENNFKSFFALLKLKKQGLYKNRVNVPNYLEKETGRFVAIYNIQTISRKLIKQNIIKLYKSDISIKTHIDQNKHVIKQARIVPKKGFIVFEVVYEVKEVPLKKCNKRYLSIDLGLNNLATIGSNVLKPQIISGKPLKSINHFFNKRVAKLKSILTTTNANTKKKTSKQIQSITNNRTNKIKDYLHKASRYIINHAVSNNISTIVVGYNKQWKQEINIGSRNNQNFVQIPHSTFVEQLKYKSKLVGINVIVNEESYTSKCSFLDNEPIQKHETYVGKRVKRGLFRSNSGKKINADLNGSLNILRKVVGDFRYPILACSTPLLVRLPR
jgi:putative transposase